ncbi:MAG: site-specific integrase, partial [Nitrospirota bacterium]|nr:site-specific integrase [Nitrospirota bacterium]
MERLDGLVERYLADLRVEAGLAGNTLEAYRRDLQKWQDFLTARGVHDPTGATRPVMSEFLAHLRRSNLSPASTARCMAALRGFFRFLCRERFLQDNPLVNLKTPRPWVRLPKVLSQDEVSRLLELPEETQPEGKRDAA